MICKFESDVWLQFFKGIKIIFWIERAFLIKILRKTNPNPQNINNREQYYKYLLFPISN